MTYSINMSSHLYIDQYKKNRLVVRGDTRLYKKELHEIGGRWNPNLKGGPGFLFLEKHLGKIITLLFNVNNKTKTNGRKRGFERDNDNDDYKNAKRQKTEDENNEYLLPAFVIAYRLKDLLIDQECTERITKYGVLLQGINFAIFGLVWYFWL